MKVTIHCVFTQDADEPTISALFLVDHAARDCDRYAEYREVARHGHETGFFQTFQSWQGELAKFAASAGDELFFKIHAIDRTVFTAVGMTYLGGGHVAAQDGVTEELVEFITSYASDIEMLGGGDLTY